MALFSNWFATNYRQIKNNPLTHRCVHFSVFQKAHSSTFQSINVFQHTIMYLLMRSDCDDGKNWIELNFFRGVYWLDSIFRCFSLENKLKQTKKIYIFFILQPMEWNQQTCSFISLQISLYCPLDFILQNRIRIWICCLLNSGINLHIASMDAQYFGIKSIET